MTTSTGTRLTDSTTDAELDALAAAGALPVVGEPEGGGEIADEDELCAIMRGRPSLGSTHATGKGASARRQVRLPERTNTALDDYATAHGMTPSAVIRQALDAFLHPAA